MNKEKEYIDFLIVSFLSGELDRVQVRELQSWISLSKENEKYFMQYQEIWASSYIEDKKEIYDADKAFIAFKKRVAESKMKSSSSYILRFRNVYKYAAAVLISMT